MSLRKILTAGCIGLVSLLLTSCGSSSNSVVSTHGVYYGVMSPSSSNSTNLPNNTAGGIGPDGKGYYFSTGVSNSGVMVFSPMNTFGTANTSMTDIPSTVHGGSPAAGTWNVTITQDTSMMSYMNMDMMEMMMMPGMAYPLVLIAGSGPNAGTADNLGLAYQSFSDAAMTTASVAGNYQGTDITRGGINATIAVSANGALTGNDGAGCSISGSLTQDPNKDMYQVNMSLSGCANAGSMTGIAFETGDDLSGTFQSEAGSYLYMVTVNSGLTAASTLEVKLQ